MAELCCTVIAKVPIHSHNHCGSRRTNTPLQLCPPDTIDSVIFSVPLGNNRGDIRNLSDVTQSVMFYCYALGGQSLEESGRNFGIK